ncbi:hypothetical protein [Dactylosporangium sp. CA-233914]|uniref:hypothetical protein n=1 Tax=Dactylosporangium sp. CA-233914 TaxID=3239934 RepID=UPI003D8FA8D0
MSFDLYVWHENQPITAAEARAKLERWGNGGQDLFAPHPAVGRFYEELLDRFPPLESLGKEDIDRLGVWSTTPERSDAIVAVSCVWSRADEVDTAVLTLAAEHGLVCYESGYHVVNPNAPGYVAPFTLSSENLPTMPDPDARRLEWIIGQVGKGNGYVILDRADGWFVQVGYGDIAGVPTGTYSLEYQEGSLERHFRCQTADREAAVRLLQEFRAGDETWKRRHTWQPL